MQEFSFKTRLDNLKKLKNEEFDLLVIGGGISGAGVARDAASRGMKVALVEARDYAEGTSSRSSKLIHGGIRYLENLEFGLVFEALSERRNLFEMAPHLVHPLRFILPLYKGSRVGMFKLGLGMWLYDLLSAFEMPQMHERLSKAELHERLPMLDASELLGGYAYSDAYMDDDLLVIETLRSAASMGAVCANFVKAVAVKDPQYVTDVQMEDSFTQEKFWVKAKHVISTVGPWTDDLAENFFTQWKKIMRPSKGVHLTFDRNRIPIKDAVVMISDDEKRIVFAIPRHEMVIIGTTDTDYKDAPENAHTTREDVNYLLEVTKNYFPHANIVEKDILSSYAGVRPLVDDGSSSESKTSREHIIINDLRNVTFLTGGKYTTYRKMAEDTVESTLKFLPIEEKVKFAKNNTLIPLNPLATIDYLKKAKHSASEMARTFEVDVDIVNKLAERHGYECLEILKTGREKGFSNYWEFEVLHATQFTMCFRLVDFYLRRTHLFLAEKDHGENQHDLITGTFAKILGWNKEQQNEELRLLKAHHELELSWHKK